MGVKQGVDYTKDEIIKEIYDCAMEVFCHGIAVPTNNKIINHPCGWDWLNFKYVDNEDEEMDILNYRFTTYDISNCCGTEEYIGLTLKEILIKTNGRFLFEINCNVDWEE